MTGLGDQDLIDFFFAFVQAAYHLRDWIEKSGSATQTQLDQLMADTPALGRCRELCNGSKHLTINDSHRYRRFHLMQEFRGEGRHQLRMIAFQPRSGGADYMYLEEFVDSVVEAWQDFCRALPPPRPDWEPVLSWT